MTFYGIQQKFLLIPELLQCFRANKGTPLFSTLHHLGTYKVHDTYCDTAKLHLSKQGLSVRYRNGCWEVIIRPGGAFNRARFPGTTSAQKIQDMLAEIDKANKERTVPQAWAFDTEREEWKVDDRFIVSIDRTDFGHWVGGVRLELPETATDEEEKNFAIANRDIQEFTKRYAWFFQREGQPKGKLAAYFETYGFPSGISEQDVKSESKYGRGLVLRMLQ